MLQSANQKRRVVAALAPALMLPTGIPVHSYILKLKTDSSVLSRGFGTSLTRTVASAS
jgi:hypothetical protein